MFRKLPAHSGGEPPAYLTDHWTSIYSYPCRAIQRVPRLDILTKVLSIDVEFVIEEDRYKDFFSKPRHRPGRVPFINYFGQVIYDVFVFYPPVWWKTIKAPEAWLRMGVYEGDILETNGARSILEVCANVRAIIEDRIVVGHAVKNDVKVFPAWVFYDVELRDTQLLEEYREHSKCPIQRMPKLSKLAEVFLNRSIQGKDHSSVEDAHATMELYRLREDEFERTQKVEIVIELRSCMRLFDKWVREGLLESIFHKSMEAYINMVQTTPAELRWFFVQHKPELRHILLPECATKHRAKDVKNGDATSPVRNGLASPQSNTLN